MANFTRGPVVIVQGDEWTHDVATNGPEGLWIVASANGRRDEVKANKALIAAAFNAATEVEEMGYDGQEAIEMLPALIKSVNRLVASHKDFMWASKNNEIPDLKWSQEIEDECTTLLGNLYE
jgi:hypothetical protein